MKNINKKKENIIEKGSDSYLKSLKEDKSFQILKLAIDGLKERYGISSNEIISLIEKKPVSKEILLPISIFEVKLLSSLEAICKYLKEELELGYSKIAVLLNRDHRTIWTTYNNSLRKAKARLDVKESKYYIPASIFKDRKLSVLEAIVRYLKGKFSLRYSEIAILLNKDERNIWGVYHRAIKKK